MTNYKIYFMHNEATSCSRDIIDFANISAGKYFKFIQVENELQKSIKRTFYLMQPYTNDLVNKKVLISPT